MAVIRNDGMKSTKAQKHKLKHLDRHVGVISNISDVYETDGFNEDEKKEQIRLQFRSKIEELRVSDDKKEELKKERKEFAEENPDLDVNTDIIELPFFVTANLTRGSTAQTSSKLYKTLKTLGLAEPYDDDKFKFCNRDRDVVKPFSDVDMNDNEAVNAKLAEYLRNNMIGMKVEYEIKNSNQGTDDEYSTVAKVIDKIEDLEG